MIKKCILILCFLAFGNCFGCVGAKPAAPYSNANQALLVGKAECLDLGWFGDKRQKVKLKLYRLNTDGSRTYINTISSEYSVLALQPGIYGLSKTHFEVGSGLLYVDKGYQTKGTPSYAPLFQQTFWQLTEMEQSLEVMKLATDCFGIIKLEAGDVLYYGDLTLDLVTNRSTPMFVAARNKTAAQQALSKTHPAKAQMLKDAGFIGPVFILGKVRDSRS